MAADAGRAHARRMRYPAAATCGVEIELRSDATDAPGSTPSPCRRRRRARRCATSSTTRRATRSTTARVAIGFGAPTPRYLALRGADGQLGANQLDRLKVRASARFLGVDPARPRRGRHRMGLRRLARRPDPRRAPRVAVGAPRLGVAHADLPHRELRLPRYRRAAGPPAPQLSADLFLSRHRGAGGARLPRPARLDRADAGRAARHGRRDRRADAGAAQPAGRRLARARGTGRHRSSCACSSATASPRCAASCSIARTTTGTRPESTPGEHPAIGFRLTEWGDVDRGQHGSPPSPTALPAGYDLDAFARQDAAPLHDRGAARCAPMERRAASAGMRRGPSAA